MDNNRGAHQATANKHGIELVKQMLLPSMLEDMKAVPKLLKESAGKSSCCIFRVSQLLAGANAEAYRPCTISIGPYHHGEPQLQMLEEHKWRYLRTMLDRIQPHGISLDNLIDVVVPNEEMIRQCYSESTDNFSGPDLVKMMVLDGCFIIELLRRGGFVLSDPDDPLLRNSYVFASLLRDLLRLENQVPYFVLEDLMEVTSVTKEALADLALNFFNCVLETPMCVSERHCNLKGLHLLDSFRLSLIPWDPQNINLADESSSYELIRSASELHRDGIRFEQRQDRTFLEIKFDIKSRTIQIPKLTIDDNLNCILLNMVAFEQCCGHCDKHVTAYAMFMGCLIQTAKDAQFLHDRGVIRNHGPSKEEVAHFFGDVWKDASCDIQRSYLASAFAGVNKYLRYDKFHVYAGHIEYFYFGSPWAVISLLFSLVSMTGVIQTVYAVLQYYQPK